QVFVRALDLKAEAGGEVLLVADHHVHVPGDLAVDLLRLLLPADRFPQRGPIIEVIGNQRAVLLGLLHRLEGQPRRGIAEGGEDATGMQPARAELTEDMVPIEVPGLELAGGRVAAVGNTHCPPYAVAAFGEVDAVANLEAYAVKAQPLYELGIH